MGQGVNSPSYRDRPPNRTLMRYPSVRNPQSIWDIFPVMFGYIVLLGVLLQVWDTSVLRGVLIIGSLILFSWVIWALDRILGEVVNEYEDET